MVQTSGCADRGMFHVEHWEEPMQSSLPTEVGWLRMGLLPPAANARWLGKTWLCPLGYFRSVVQCDRRSTQAGAPPEESLRNARPRVSTQRSPEASALPRVLSELSSQ